MPRGTSRLDEARHQGRLWTPAHLTTKPHAWYEASDLATITAASGLVSQWNDKSGNARHVVQATGSAKPTLTQTGINNLISLSLDGGDSLLGSSFGLTGSACAAFAVTTTVDATSSRMLSFGSSAAAGNDWDNLGSFTLFCTGSTISSFANSLQRGTPIAISNNTPNLWAVIAGGGNWQLWKDGTGSAATSYTPTLNADRLGVGFNSMAGAEQYKGLYGAVLVLGYEPSPADRQRIEGYLAHRWSLTANLPASHPYRTAPPLIGT